MGWASHVILLNHMASYFKRNHDRAKLIFKTVPEMHMMHCVLEKLLLNGPEPVAFCKMMCCWIRNIT